MQGLRRWLRDRLRERPPWMNALMLFCAYMTFIYMPWDFFIKPVSADEEVWFGIVLRGPLAKLTEPVHWAIYGAGAYGLWRMRPWMWPWASVYTALVAFSMFVWAVVYHGGLGGFAWGVLAAVVLLWLAHALWNARDWFAGRREPLTERYGRWAVVTGASAGIGEQFAHALASEGCSLVLVARREDRLEELARMLEEEHGVETRVVGADLATDAGIARVAEVASSVGATVLVNNAGVGYAGAFVKQDLARLQSLVRLNCMAVMELTHRLLDPMLESGRGAVIIVASVAGRQPIPLHAVYAASKSFDLLFGEALWVELRERGIDVLVLQPGPVATEFEEVAGEKRPPSIVDEDPRETVRYALEALGRQPSVVSGGVLNWARANVNRALPRAVIAFLAGDFMARQTPAEMR